MGIPLPRFEGTTYLFLFRGRHRVPVHALRDGASEERRSDSFSGHEVQLDRAAAWAKGIKKRRHALDLIIPAL